MKDVHCTLVSLLLVRAYGAQTDAKVSIDTMVQLIPFHVSGLIVTVHRIRKISDRSTEKERIPMSEHESFSNSIYEEQTRDAERELSAFIRAVTKSFGPEQARVS